MTIGYSAGDGVRQSIKLINQEEYWREKATRACLQELQTATDRNYSCSASSVLPFPKFRYAPQTKHPITDRLTTTNKTFKELYKTERFISFIQNARLFVLADD